MPPQTYDVYSFADDVFSPNSDFVIMDMYNKVVHTADNYDEAISWAKQQASVTGAQYVIYKKFAEICDEMF